MPPKSSVIRSPFRKEIEEMIIEGKSSRYISKWLKEHDEQISHTAINNYRKGEFSIKEEAAIEYVEKQSKVRKKKAVKKQVSDIEKIDKFIKKVNPEVMGKMDPKDQVRSVNNLLKTKYQILGEINEGTDINVNVVNNNEVKIPEDPAIRARGRDFIRSIRPGQMESSNPGNGDK